MLYIDYELPKRKLPITENKKFVTPARKADFVPTGLTSVAQ